MDIHIDSLEYQEQAEWRNYLNGLRDQDCQTINHTIHTDICRNFNCTKQVNSVIGTHGMDTKYNTALPFSEFPASLSLSTRNTTNSRLLKPSISIDSGMWDDELERTRGCSHLGLRSGGSSWTALWCAQAGQPDLVNCVKSRGNLNTGNVGLECHMGLLNISGRNFYSLAHPTHQTVNLNSTKLPCDFSLVRKQEQQRGPKAKTLSHSGTGLNYFGSCSTKKNGQSNKPSACVVGTKCNIPNKAKNPIRSSSKVASFRRLPVVRGTICYKSADPSPLFPDPTNGATDQFYERIQTLLYLEEVTKRWERSQWRRKWKRRRAADRPG